MSGDIIRNVDFTTEQKKGTSWDFMGIMWIHDDLFIVDTT